MIFWQRFRNEKENNLKGEIDMKNNMLWLSIIMVFIIVVSTQAQVKKYDIKSGIVTLEIVSTIGSTQIKMTKVVYFDDYGTKECEETYTNGKLGGVFFCDGKNKIGLNLKSKKAHIQEPSDRGTGMRIDINDMGTKEDIQSGKVKKIAPMTIAGQTCEMIQAGKGKDVTIYGGWHQVMVYMKSDGSSVKTLIKAVKLEANVAVPKEKFEVPAGFTMQ
jgi:hypothetical protein